MDPVVFDWTRYDASWRCELPGEVTLFATPNASTHFGTKPKRGTKWRAGASLWCEATHTVSRFGEDVYGIQFATAKEAMRRAELVYLAGRAA